MPVARANARLALAAAEAAEQRADPAARTAVREAFEAVWAAGAGTGTWQPLPPGWAGLGSSTEEAEAEAAVVAGMDQLGLSDRGRDGATAEEEGEWCLVASTATAAEVVEAQRAARAALEHLFAAMGSEGAAAWVRRATVQAGAEAAVRDALGKL